MRLAFLLVVAGVALGAGAPGGSDLDKFQGNWRLVSLHNEGRELPAEEVKSIKVTIKGETISLDDGKNVEKFTFKLDPKARPAAIDLNVPGEKKPLLGIYDFKGDTLRIGMALEGARLTEMPVAPHKDRSLMVLERVKK